MRLATAAHPYSPDAWLSKEQAEAYLWRQRDFPMRLTLGFCRKHDIEVASTGHIRLLALEGYVKRWKHEEAQRQADLEGRGL